MQPRPLDFNALELMHMIKKKQTVVEAGDEGHTAAKQFYALAA